MLIADLPLVTYCSTDGRGWEVRYYGEACSSSFSCTKTASPDKTTSIQPAMKTLWFDKTPNTNVSGMRTIRPTAFITEPEPVRYRDGSWCCICAVKWNNSAPETTAIRTCAAIVIHKLLPTESASDAKPSKIDRTIFIRFELRYLTNEPPSPPKPSMNEPAMPNTIAGADNAIYHS